MASYNRKCERSGCENICPTRTWWDEDYDENNPFLCISCRDKLEEIQKKVDKERQRVNKNGN